LRINLTKHLSKALHYAKAIFFRLLILLPQVSCLVSSWPYSYI